jgi:hypothetical protein
MGRKWAENGHRLWADCGQIVGKLWADCGQKVGRKLAESGLKLGLGRLWAESGQKVGRKWAESGQNVGAMTSRYLPSVCKKGETSKMVDATHYALFLLKTP